MAYFKVGGQIDFMVVVRAKADEDPEEILEKAIRKAWRDGQIYCDLASQERCNRDGDILNL